MRKETAESPKDGVLRSQAAELNLLLLDQAMWTYHVRGSFCQGAKGKSDAPPSRAAAGNDKYGKIEGAREGICRASDKSLGGDKSIFYRTGIVSCTDSVPNKLARVPRRGESTYKVRTREASCDGTKFWWTVIALHEIGQEVDLGEMRVREG